MSSAFVATQIICTIGPVTQSEEKLEELMKAGMKVARLNFSHGTHEYHASTIANVRAVTARTGHTCAIMLDTKGPEIRTVKLVDGNDVKLVAGQEFTLLNDPTVIGDQTKVATTYVDLAESMTVGGAIMIDDGLIELQVTSIDEAAGAIKCVVVNGGLLGENKGVNLPAVVVNLPAVTEKDKGDLQFGVEQKVDAIAASFIRKPEDLQVIRALLGEAGKQIKIISKIENLEGLENFPAILDQSDGIMVARGDLGVEIPLEKVCLAQKMMIQHCNAVGKPVVTATQMLESMIVNPRPTRAEATDVANAVFDGTDCVMLSGETAKGSYPVECVATMRKICAEAESASEFSRPRESIETASNITPWEPAPIAHLEGICSAATVMTQACGAKLLIARTETGSTALMLSKQRPGVPIVAITPDACTARQLNFSRSIIPLFVAQEDMNDVSNVMRQAVSAGVKRGGLKAGEFIVNVRGFVSGVAGTTNGVSLIRAPRANEIDPAGDQQALDQPWSDSLTPIVGPTSAEEGVPELKV